MNRNGHVAPWWHRRDEELRVKTDEKNLKNKYQDEQHYGSHTHTHTGEAQATRAPPGG